MLMHVCLVNPHHGIYKQKIVTRVASGHYLDTHGCISYTYKITYRKDPNQIRIMFYHVKDFEKDVC